MPWYVPTWTPKSARYCVVLLAIARLTFGIGYDVVVGTTFADFTVIVAGLFVGWVAFVYCLGHLMGWNLPGSGE